MSDRYNSGSHYENHQRAAELHQSAAQAHRVAEQHGKGEHLTGHEHSRQALEHSQQAHEHTRKLANEHGTTKSHHEEISDLAYELWEARGRPEGSPQQDWFKASNIIGSRSL